MVGDKMKIHEISLLSADNLGLSHKESSIQLPEADIYKVKYEDKYGRQLDVAGDYEKVKRTLVKAGYKIQK